MTNNEIIYSEVNAKYHTPEQRRAILALAYTPEQIAAKGKEIHFQDVPEEQQGEELEKLLLAGLFHTFHEWKERGKSVKTGEKAAIDTRLWKLDTRPRKTRSSGKKPDALTKAAEEQDDNGNYYKAPAHLFHIGQVEASRPAPAGRFKSLDEIRAYNKMLADQRKSAKTAAEQAASVAPIITEERHELPELVHVDPLPAKKAAKKASKPTAPKSAKKPAATKSAPQKSAPQKSAQPAPDELRTAQQAEREAKAAFLAVPDTDRKGQAAALDAWRKTRKAVEDAKQTPAAVAVLDEAPVKQLDFESIAAGLLA